MSADDEPTAVTDGSYTVSYFVLLVSLICAAATYIYYKTRRDDEDLLTTEPVHISARDRLYFHHRQCDECLEDIKKNNWSLRDLCPGLRREKEFLADNEKHRIVQDILDSVLQGKDKKLHDIAAFNLVKLLLGDVDSLSLSPSVCSKTLFTYVVNIIENRQTGNIKKCNFWKFQYRDEGILRRLFISLDYVRYIAFRDMDVPENIYEQIVDTCKFLEIFIIYCPAVEKVPLHGIEKIISSKKNVHSVLQTLTCDYIFEKSYVTLAWNMKESPFEISVTFTNASIKTLASFRKEFPTWTQNVSIVNLKKPARGVINETMAGFTELCILTVTDSNETSLTGPRTQQTSSKLTYLSIQGEKPVVETSFLQRLSQSSSKSLLSLELDIVGVSDDVLEEFLNGCNNLMAFSVKKARNIPDTRQKEIFDKYKIIERLGDYHRMLFLSAQEAERQKQERLEQERQEQVRKEQERLEQVRKEQERLEQERKERERLEHERLEQVRKEQERLEQERLEKERQEQERHVEEPPQARRTIGRRGNHLAMPIVRMGNPQNL